MRISKKIAGILLKGWISIPYSLLSIFNNDGSFYWTQFAGYVEKKTKYFFSYNIRPKKETDFVCAEDITANADRFAIIMQGSLEERNDFTLETIKLYRRIFPGVLIIVSTWESENIDYINRIKQISDKIIVIMNKYPEFSGFGNCNYQQVTTRAGIDEANKRGKEFVFKTRCDYRFYKRGLLEFMCNLVIDYPLGDYGSEFKQKYRIIFASERGGNMFRPFWIGDQFNFGYIDDMINFWGNELEDRNFNSAEFTKLALEEGLSWKEQKEKLKSLTTKYSLRMRGVDFDNSVFAWWEFIKSNFIMLSAQDVDAYWYKYDFRFEETSANGTYLRDDDIKKCLSYNWNFVNWLNLYHGSLTYKDWMESISENNTK